LKKRIVPVLLVLALLTGCTSMLNREYVFVAPHNQFSDTGTDSSALRAETYQGLVNAILYLVSQGTGEGVIRLYNYTRDVETDLNNACLEVAKKDPLGAYAVDYIKYDFDRIVSYYEANLNITYRRTVAQIKSVVSVTGSSAIKGELLEALTAFSPEVVLRVSYFTENEDYIIGLIQQAYYDTPDIALGLPEVAVSLYPDSGFQRIVELILTYPDTAGNLQQMRNTLTVVSKNYAADFMAADGDLPTAIYALLRDRVLYQHTENGLWSTAYAALVAGRADSEGFALAFHLLCKLTDTESVVVHGTQDGQLYFWNMVRTEDGWRHMDATSSKGLLLKDDAMHDAGYAWNAESYPVCDDSGVSPT